MDLTRREPAWARVDLAPRCRPKLAATLDIYPSNGPTVDTVEVSHRHCRGEPTATAGTTAARGISPDLCTIARI